MSLGTPSNRRLPASFAVEKRLSIDQRSLTGHLRTFVRSTEPRQSGRSRTNAMGRTATVEIHPELNNLSQSNFGIFEQRRWSADRCVLKFGHAAWNLVCGIAALHGEGDDGGDASSRSCRCNSYKAAVAERSMETS